MSSLPKKNGGCIVYGKFFASTFTGSMFGAGPEVFAVWGYVIANTVNSSVELNPVMLAAVIGSSPERVESAITFLCRPDPLSRNKDCDGCRLVYESAFQYHVVSHALYRAIRNEDDRREYNRQKQAESRARRKKTKASKQRVIDSQSLSAMSAHTEAEADTEAKEQKPSPKPRKRGSEERTKTALAKDRHDEFKSIVKEYLDSKNKGIQMPWAGPEGKQLEMFLRAAPNITAEQFRGFLRNRFKSEVNHGERPSRWLPWVTSYGAGPVDKFGKTIHSQENSNGRPGTNQPSAARQRVDNNRRALAEAAIKRGWITVDGANGATPAPIPESGQRGFDSGIPDGPRTVEPEVLAPESRRSDSGPAH